MVDSDVETETRSRRQSRPRQETESESEPGTESESATKPQSSHQDTEEDDYDDDDDGDDDGEITPSPQTTPASHTTHPETQQQQVTLPLTKRIQYIEDHIPGLNRLSNKPDVTPKRRDGEAIRESVRELWPIIEATPKNKLQRNHVAWVVSTFYLDILSLDSMQYAIDLVKEYSATDPDTGFNVYTRQQLELEAETTTSSA